MSTATVELKPVSQLCCMNADGDKRLMWDSSDADATSEAEKTFQEYKAKGWLDYKTNAKGAEGQVIDKFDPYAERIIMRPQMIGG